jgi:hypothetical protein
MSWKGGKERSYFVVSRREGAFADEGWFGWGGGCMTEAERDILGEVGVGRDGQEEEEKGTRLVFGLVLLLFNDHLHSHLL